MSADFHNADNTEETPIVNRVDEVSNGSAEGESESPIVKALRSHFSSFPLLSSSQSDKKEQKEREEEKEGYNPKGINYGYF